MRTKSEIIKDINLAQSLCVPKYLFRGDSDRKNLRQLRATINSGLLLTNLCGGGNGREIFCNTLGQLINRHIGVGWSKTHFLSFSANQETAFFYASKNEQYDETYDYQEPWDFAVFTLDTTIFISDSIKKIDTGIYAVKYLPTCREFLPTYNLILIDAYSHLKNIGGTNSNFTQAIEKADRDKEWLVLPANPFGYNGELTAKLDTNCITEKRLFKLQ